MLKKAAKLAAKALLPCVDPFTMQNEPKLAANRFSTPTRRRLEMRTVAVASNRRRDVEKENRDLVNIKLDRRRAGSKRDISRHHILMILGFFRDPQEHNIGQWFSTFQASNLRHLGI